MPERSFVLCRVEGAGTEQEEQTAPLACVSAEGGNGMLRSDSVDPRAEDDAR